MSNQSSSTRSQLTDASGMSNRNAESSFGIVKHRSLKTCDYSWNVNISRPQTNWGFEAVSSPVFSSVDDDLEWRLELAKQSANEDEFISVTLQLDTNVFFEKYNAISGNVELSVKRRENGSVRIKKKCGFVIQNTDGTPVLPRIGFSDPWACFDRPGARASRPSNQLLKIVCNVTYETTEKNIRLRENHIPSLSDDLETLFTDKQFSDVIIKVQDKEYPVYKGILAARSPVFKAMFRENNNMTENTTNVVKISDICPEVIKEVLLFIYTGKVKNLEKLVYELLPVANKYQLEGLKEMCEDTLFKQLSKDNAINILILAHEHNASWLKTEALQFVKLHSRYADLKDTEIWQVLSSYRDLMQDLVAVLLDK